MTIFVDASALVALLTLEEGYEELADKLDDDDTRLTSALSVWEATLAISRSRGIMLDFAKEDLAAFMSARGVAMAAIGENEGMVALEAQRRFGKGRHPANLNMGDCFSYACAKTNNASLLYKGDDFARTDLA